MFAPYIEIILAIVSMKYTFKKTAEELLNRWKSKPQIWEKYRGISRTKWGIKTWLNFWGYFMEHHGTFTAPFCFVSTFMGHSSEYNKDSTVGHRYKKVVGFPMFNHWMLLMSKRHLNLRHCNQCVYLVVRVSDHSDHPLICSKYKLPSGKLT